MDSNLEAADCRAVEGRNKIDLPACVRIIAEVKTREMIDAMFAVMPEPQTEEEVKAALEWLFNEMRVKCVRSQGVSKV